METTDAPSSPGRSWSWLLIALGIVIAVFAISRYWPGSPAASPAAPSNARARAAAADDPKLDPEALDVRLEALNAPTPENAEGGRNPFRFRPPPPPPPPPAPPPRPPVQEQPKGPVGPPQPPPPPPIPLKFIGIVEVKPGDRVAAFSDCRTTLHGREGQILMGQYRLVRLGLESVVMEYVDGRGRTTIRLSGQDCIGK